MAPRKRAKPNPADVSSTSLPASSTNPATSTSPTPAPPAPGMPSSASRGSSAREDEDKEARSSTNLDDQKHVRKSQSWYSSWPRISKSAASTPQIARETILGGTLRPTSSNDLKRFDSRKTSDSQSTAESTEAAPVLSNIPENNTTLAASREGDATANSSTETGKDAEPLSSETSVPDRPATSGNERPSSQQQPATSSGWLSWLGRTPAPGATKPVSPTANASKEPSSSQNPVPDATPQPQTTTAPTPQRPATPRSEAQPPTTASWFSFWSTTPKPNADASQNEEVPKTPVASATSTKNTEDTPTTDAPPTAPAKSPPPSAGSTWAFWSRDVRPKSNAKPSSKPPSEPGELAVIGQGSEAHPEPSGGMEVASDSAKENRETEPKTSRSANSTSAKKSKKPQSQSVNTEESLAPSGTTTPQPVASSKSSVAESVQDDGRGKSAASKQASAIDEPAKALPPNLLLPSFDSTYKLKENPSILKQITQLLLRTQQPPANHVFRAKETPKIRKAIAIGVHGLFPASYLRPMIGQPTGTSLRFANQCADGIRRWTDAHGCSDCEIEKVALEGEGKIMDRVDNLWKLLLNWIEPLRRADLIIIACHSQGVPVAVMLLAKLVDLGIISNTKIGICAMAGVCLGPFPDYNWKSSMGMLMGTAAELWEFSNPDSSISQRYEAALKEVLEHGARITYIGSIDDQLVPMESAIYSPASHPYIYRAVFIDGRIHAPDFIAHLVGFALKLRNLGVSDHGLIRELSTPLAGSLYSGEGHSRIYHDQQVYDLAVAHALETTDIATLAPNKQCQVHHPHRPATPSSSAAAGVQAQPSSSAATGGAKAPSSVPAARSPLANPNPYHLPWIMRGLLEEDFVKTELSAETEELLRQFDDWKPTTKALKDVKYRLEAVRSKL